MPKHYTDNYHKKYIMYFSLLINFPIKYCKYFSVTDILKTFYMLLALCFRHLRYQAAFVFKQVGDKNYCKH